MGICALSFPFLSQFLANHSMSFVCYLRISFEAPQKIPSSPFMDGFCRPIGHTKSEIDWYCYRKKDQNIYEKVSKKDKVDAIVVLDPHALEELGEQSDEDSYQGADIYGIGSSVKAVVLLDNGNIQGLVVPDAYEIGYKSVGEMAQRLEHRFYRLKGHKTEIKVFDRDEFSLNDNLERFLYSYE